MGWEEQVMQIKVMFHQMPKEEEGRTDELPQGGQRSDTEEVGRTEWDRRMVTSGGLYSFKNLAPKGRKR